MFRELNLNPVARQQPDPIPFRGPGAMRQNLLLIHQLQPVHQAGQFLDYRGFHPDYCRVSTHGPSLVTATQCSKWAE